MTIPNRYTGANCFSTQDYAGNVFYVYQGPNDSGCCVMEPPGQPARVVLTLPGSGRPTMECNPSVGLWMTGNKETPANQPPLRYPIAEYVPFPAQAPGLVAATPSLLPAPLISPLWHARAMAKDEGLLVNIPAVFGVAPAAVYKVRLSVQSSIAGVTARIGIFSAPYFLTQTTQVAGVRIDCQGDVPGDGTWVSCVGGAATVWLQVLGV